MTTGSGRRISREYKLAALRRMLAGENVSALARELGVLRKDLYKWREQFRAGGAAALRGPGRPRKSAAEPPSMPAAGVPEAGLRVDADGGDASRLRRRIAELERKVGQQQVELDFFQRALRQVRELRRETGGPGGPASTRSSKR
jgi:transposase-like protein